MKSLLTWLCSLGLLAVLSSAQASLSVNADVTSPEESTRPLSDGSLDTGCRFDFIGLTTGTHSGTLTWPGHSGGYYMSGYKFLNTCAVGETLYAYCMDLDHDLNQSPYCGTIDTLSVRSDFAEQYPAMAYLLTWFQPTTALDDRIQQLALWKMVTNLRTGSATYGTPYYRVPAGRGWPNLADAPAYPYVNTVYASDAAVNTPANDRVRFALGATDGIPKNVIHGSDVINAHYARATIEGDSVVRTVITLSVTRGADAIAVNNLATGGIRLLVNSGSGRLSAAEVFTNADGIAEITLTTPVGARDDAIIEVCSKGLWLRAITPCLANTSQISVLQARAPGDLCTVCTTVRVPGDHFLPVEMAAVDAAATGTGIQISWRTASETNLARWEIQRRTGNDAYGILATLPATNQTGGQSYRYIDTHVQAGVNYQYRLVDVDMNGVRTPHDDWTRTASITEQAALSAEYSLGANYPNPFNPTTHINFALPEAGLATLTVFDVTGQAVAVLVNGRLASGSHTADFAAGALPSGVYFYRLQCGDFSQTKKMILMK